MQWKNVLFSEHNRSKEHQPTSLLVLRVFSLKDKHRLEELGIS